MKTIMPPSLFMQQPSLDWNYSSKPAEKLGQVIGENNDPKNTRVLHTERDGIRVGGPSRCIRRPLAGNSVLQIDFAATETWMARSRIGRLIEYAGLSLNELHYAVSTGTARRRQLVDVFKAFPEASEPLIKLLDPLLHGPSPFTQAERELIAAYVSDLNHCQYCHPVHTAIATLLGTPHAAVAETLDSIEAAPVSDKTKPVLRCAHKLAYADAIFAAGGPPDALFFTVAVTAPFNLMNRLVEGLGIKLDPNYVRPTSERLARGG